MSWSNPPRRGSTRRKKKKKMRAHALSGRRRSVTAEVTQYKSIKLTRQIIGKLTLEVQPLERGFALGTEYWFLFLRKEWGSWPNSEIMTFQQKGVVSLLPKISRKASPTKTQPFVEFTVKWKPVCILIIFRVQVLTLGWRLCACSRRSGTVHTPGEVVRLCCSRVFVHQVLNDVTGIIHFVKAILKHGFLAELIEKSFPFPQFIELLQRPRKKLAGIKKR